MSRGENRIDKLFARMEEREIDVSLIVFPIHVYYFTGFLYNPHERLLALVADRRSREAKLLVPALDREAALAHWPERQTVAIRDTEDPLALLNREIGGGVRTIGLEKGRVTVRLYESLRGAFPDASFVDLDPWMTSVRLKKSESEMEQVRRAVEAVERVMAVAVQKIKPGMTESELAAELEYEARRLGPIRPAFDFTVLTGKRSAFPHMQSGPYAIQPRDFVVVDIGVSVGGYCSDITRTFVAGECTKEQERMYQAVLEANRRAVELASAGIPLGRLDQAAREVIDAWGYGKYFTHRLGHGLGLEIHEPPSVHGENGSPVEPGMLFTIEPGIYIPSIGGVRIEDDVYIREDGSVEVVTRFSRELQCI